MYFKNISSELRISIGRYHKLMFKQTWGIRSISGIQDRHYIEGVSSQHFNKLNQTNMLCKNIKRVYKKQIYPAPASTLLVKPCNGNVNKVLLLLLLLLLQAIEISVWHFLKSQHPCQNHSLRSLCCHCQSGLTQNLTLTQMEYAKPC